MIILEGPDGGGKTTLLRALQRQYPRIALHPRASEGVKGPVQNLYEWAMDDVLSWPTQQLSFYDRHPLVSEYIYGPIVRRTMDTRFHTGGLRRHFARRALVIACVPPRDAVRRAVSAERDMPGVTPHIDAILTSYAALDASWPCSTGLLFYDYTRGNTFQWHTLLANINQHIEQWENDYGQH